MAEADARSKTLAGLGLVAVSTSVGILYKVSQAKSGGFKYSTTSAIAIAEFTKLCMSASFHVLDSSHRTETSGGPLRSAWLAAKAQMNLGAVFHIWILALMYTVNNQVSFFMYTLADPGTIFLFKAGSTMITAIIQCTLVGKVFTPEQWKAMFLQGIGMVVVQYNPCRGGARYRPLAYGLMVFSAVMTSLCAVRNEYLVKNYKIGLNVQNMVLYSGGMYMNLLAFHAIPNPNSSQGDVGFFDGYNDPFAIGVVFSNAMIGLAITAVYKYADAITKCIASDVTAVLLCIASTFLFELQASVTMWCGVMVVCFAVHLYVGAQPAAPPRPTVNGSPEESKRLQDDESAEGGSKEDKELAQLVGRGGEVIEDRSDRTGNTPRRTGEP